MTNFLILNDKEIAITDRYGTFVVTKNNLAKDVSFKDANKIAIDNGYICPDRITCVRL